MRRYDVIIVGAGPAGSTLAIPLARAGLEVLILDKDRFPRDKTCGDFVGPSGLRVLRDLDCLADIEQSNCLPVYESRVYIEEDLTFHGKIPTDVPEWGYGYIVPRFDLDHTLFQVAQSAGAKGIDGCRVKEFALERGGIHVTATREGRQEVYHGRLIVGADGANSVIAASAGLSSSDPRYIHLSQRAYGDGLDLAGETALWFGEQFFPGFGWFFPVADGRVNIGVGLASSTAHKHRMRLPEFMQAMTDLAGRWAREQGNSLEIGPVKGWVLKTYGGQARTFFERGLLIGDAGSFVDPISGQGISIAMETAQIAAQTIYEAFDAGDFSRRFLSCYQARCSTAMDTNLRLADLIVTIVRNRYLVHSCVDTLRIICDASQKDPEFARRLGGIMSGSVGATEGVSFGVLARAVVHEPKFWFDLLGLSNLAPRDALAQLQRRLNRDISALATMSKDGEWLIDWWTEVQSKQLGVLAALIK